MRSLAQKSFKREKQSLKDRILRKAIIRTEEDYADDAQAEREVTDTLGEQVFVHVFRVFRTSCLTIL
jgi:hypothetical protein